MSDSIAAYVYDEILEREGYKSEYLCNTVNALRKLKDGSDWSSIIIDLHTQYYFLLKNPHENGIDLIKSLRKIYPSKPIISVSHDGRDGERCIYKSPAEATAHFNQDGDWRKLVEIVKKYVR